MNEKNTVILQIDDRSWTLTREVERDRYALPGTGRAASVESEALHTALGWAMVSDGWPLAVDGKPAAVLFFGEVRVSEDCVISLSLRWREREEPAKSRQHVLRVFSSTPFWAEEHIAAALRGSLATIGASGSYAAALVHDRARRSATQPRQTCGEPVPAHAPHEFRYFVCTLEKGHARPDDHSTGKGYGLPSFSWGPSFAPPPPDPVAERRAREAPLVALVTAVPSWADPVAWRAAVLAVKETTSHETIARWHADGSLFEWIVSAIFDEKTDRAVHGAYRRALAPSAAVRPEWRERLPHGLACNAHEVP